MKRTRWTYALVIGAALVALVTLLVLRAGARHRGTASPGFAGALLVYAKSPAGAERLAAQVPGTMSGVWSKQETVRLSLRHRGEAYVYALGVDPGGAVQTYFPSASENPRQLGDGKLRALGAPFQVGALHQTGPVRLFVVLARQPLLEEKRAQLARATRAHPEEPFAPDAEQLSVSFQLER